MSILPHCSIISLFCGCLSYDILSMFMLVGPQGVEYYREAHLMPWNAWTHSLVMPISTYGVLITIPSIFNLTPENAKLLINVLYCLWMGHYLRVNVLGAFLYFFMYFYTVYRATNVYKHDYLFHSKPNYIINWYGCAKGICIATAGLTFQEIVGHQVGGDIPSRPEAVPNAILYAMYFSSAHLL